VAILGVGRDSGTIWFNWLEVAKALLQMREIHTGWWRIGMQLDLHGGSFVVPTGKTTTMKVPGGIMTVVNINLKEVAEDKVDELCVNAAVVNPRPAAILNAFGARVN